MGLLRICVFFALTTFAVKADVERQNDKDLRLKVIRPSGDKYLTLHCSMIPYRTYVNQVTKIEIFAADQLDGETGEYKLLAAVAKGWDDPKLSVRVTDSEASVDGEVLEADDEMSYLEFSWKSDTAGYCKSYECVATGLDKDGNPATSFTTNRVKSTENTQCVSS